MYQSPQRHVGAVIRDRIGGAQGVKTLGLATVFVAFAACTHLDPSLETVYGEARVSDSRHPPLVIVHGVFGSKLRDAATEKTIWPPPSVAANSHGSWSVGDFAPAQAYALSHSNQPYALSGELFRTLERFGGYRRARVGQLAPADGHPYYVFLYDWRQDSVETARQLDAFLQAIRTARDNLDEKVDIIAHGTGGLIVRYYLRYGREDVTRDNAFPVSLAGSRYVRRVILLGTPNLGFTEMLRAVALGNRIGDVALSPDWAARMPSLYQFFPHPISQPLVSNDGTPSDLDHFDVDTWTKNRWGPFAQRGIQPEEAKRRRLVVETYLERGRRFIWSLTVPAKDTPVRFVVFGGACHGTSAKALLQRDGDQLRLRFETNTSSAPLDDAELLMQEPGDGLVTKSSLLARQTIDPTIARHRYSFFSLHYAAFFCARHNRLDRNYDLQNNLLHALLSADPA